MLLFYCYCKFSGKIKEWLKITHRTVFEMRSCANDIFVQQVDKSVENVLDYFYCFVCMYLIVWYILYINRTFFPLLFKWEIENRVLLFPFLYIKTFYFILRCTKKYINVYIMCFIHSYLSYILTCKVSHKHRFIIVVSICYSLT